MPRYDHPLHRPRATCERPSQNHSTAIGDAMSNELTRRRVIVTSPDIVEVITEVVPPLKPGEALVEMSVSGMCGSDKAGVHGEHAFMKPPYYPGHRSEERRAGKEC